MYDFSVISGHIIQRNRNHQTSDFTVTLKIDQKLQQSTSRIPSEWWNGLPSIETPLTAIYGLGMLKVQHYTAQKMLYLPYMLKS